MMWPIWCIHRLNLHVRNLSWSSKGKAACKDSGTNTGTLTGMAALSLAVILKLQRDTTVLIWCRCTTLNKPAFCGYSWYKWSTCRQRRFLRSCLDKQHVATAHLPYQCCDTPVYNFIDNLVNYIFIWNQMNLHHQKKKKKIHRCRCCVKDVSSSDWWWRFAMIHRHMIHPEMFAL